MTLEQAYRIGTQGVGIDIFHRMVRHSAEAYETLAQLPVISAEQLYLSRVDEASRSYDEELQVFLRQAQARWKQVLSDARRDYERTTS